MRYLYWSISIIFFTLKISAQTTEVSNVSDLLNVIEDIENGQTIDEIKIKEGLYNLSEPILLNAAHNGLKITACGDVRLNGGIEIPLSSFQNFSTINEPGFTLAPEIAQNIKVVDLLALNVSSQMLGSINHHGYGFSDDFETPAVLWLDEQKMTLSRWPNKDEEMTVDQMIIPTKWEDIRDEMHGQVSYEEMTHGGTKKSATDGPVFTLHSSLTNQINLWQYHLNSDEKIWMDGVLHSSWEWEYNEVKEISNNQITLQNGGSGSPNIKVVDGKSVNTNTKVSHFYFENIPEELDTPGEYFIDRENMRLYFYPISGWQDKKITLSTLNSDLIQISDAENITIENLIVEVGHKNALNILNSSQIKIQNTVVRNVNQWGIRVTGSNNTVDNVEVYNVGAGGVKLGKEQNSYSITDELNEVKNSTIHDFAWDQKSQVPGITLSGSLNKAINNEIYAAPHFAVKLRQARSCEVNNNRIHDLPNYHHFDGGAIYLGLGHGFHQRENKINNNYIYKVPTNGIYLDNYTTGNFVKGNVLVDIGNSTEGANYAAIYNHGGGDNLYEDNIAVNCKVMVKTGSHIVKHGSTFKYLQSWYNATKPGAALNRDTGPHYQAFVNKYQSSNLGAFIDKITDLPSIVKQEISSMNSTSWQNVKWQWAQWGYQAYIDSNNSQGLSEWQEWKNYYELIFTSSTVKNNLNISENQDYVYDGPSGRYSGYTLGDQKVFWEFSPYLDYGNIQNQTQINAVNSRHITQNNAYYSVSQSATVFPNLITNGALNELIYGLYSFSNNDLNQAIPVNIGSVGDLNPTSFSDCEWELSDCDLIGLDYAKYSSDGSCDGLQELSKNSETNVYELDLSSGSSSNTIVIDLLVSPDTSQNKGFLKSLVENINDNDIFEIVQNPDNAFSLSYVDHNWSSDKTCTWNWNRRVQAKINFDKTDSETREVVLKFNPNGNLKSHDGLSYCQQLIKINYKKSTDSLSVDNKEKPKVRIYPTVVQNKLNIDAPYGMHKLSVFNAAGQLLDLIDLGLTNSFVYDVENHKPGMYFVRIETSEGIVSSRFIRK